MLTEFCQKNSVVIANTLFQQHKTQLHTWTSPDGQYQNQTDYILCIPIPHDENDLFLVSVLEGLVHFHKTIQLQLLSISGWGTDLDFCGIEWFAL